MGDPEPRERTIDRLKEFAGRMASRFRHELGEWERFTEDQYPHVALAECECGGWVGIYITEGSDDIEGELTLSFHEKMLRRCRRQVPTRRGRNR